MDKFILALDQGTTSSRAIIFDQKGSVKALVQKEFKQYFPNPGWVEHDAEEIWQSQIEVAIEVLKKAGITADNIAAIGITNQRETTVIWNRETGKPICNAIVWQDRRTSGYCDQLKSQGLESTFKEKTGLVIDAYFSGSKINWILNNIEGAREMAEEGKLAFGTIDSWLVWNFTGGRNHVTDVTNASRTLLFNIHTLQWDRELLDLLEVPQSLLPEVKSCSEQFGDTLENILGTSIPITGIAGDQQAALFGQMCLTQGMVKNTYGTGCFIVMNTGSKPVNSQNNLLSTIAWKIGDKINYALEGSIFVAGAVVQWLRDGLGIIKSSGEIEELAMSVQDNGGVYFVPAFTGLGAPHWDQYARGNISGITRGTTAGHIARAALESIAFQTMDVLRAMQQDSGIHLKELRVDGGATANHILMQFQADLLKISVVKPTIQETTALGAAYLAGLAVGYWKNVEEINNLWQIDKNFKPAEDDHKLSEMVMQWEKALERSKNWITSS